jgi:hypothetical protein
MYANDLSERSLGVLVTAVMNLPLNQWPENACRPKRAVSDPTNYIAESPLTHITS